MQHKLSCIIVDDDEIDRLTTKSFVGRTDFIDIAGVFENAEAALMHVKKQAPDILFLDVDMPGISGLELRSQLMHIAACVFITSYPDYAVESFDKEAFDFLLKPVKQIRFDKTMERLKEYFIIRNKAALLSETLGDDTIFIKEGHNQVKIQLHEVAYLEALKDYTGIITHQKKYCVLSPLSSLLQQKPFQSFVRIHRSYAVQKNYIQKITGSEVILNDNTILPLGRSFKNTITGI